VKGAQLREMRAVKGHAAQWLPPPRVRSKYSSAAPASPVQVKMRRNLQVSVLRVVRRLIRSIVKWVALKAAVLAQAVMLRITGQGVLRKGEESVVERERVCKQRRNIVDRRG